MKLRFEGKYSRIYEDTLSQASKKSVSKEEYFGFSCQMMEEDAKSDPDRYSVRTIGNVQGDPNYCLVETFEKQSGRPSNYFLLVKEPGGWRLTSSLYLFVKGSDAYKRKDYKGAILYLSKAIEVNPYVPGDYDLLSYVYRDDPAVPGHQALAYSNVRIAIQYAPKDFPSALAVYYSDLADLYRTDKKVDEAVENYKTSLGLDAGNPQTHFLYGMTLYRKGKKQEGLGHVHKALELKPGYPNAKRFLENPKVFNH